MEKKENVVEEISINHFFDKYLLGFIDGTDNYLEHDKRSGIGRSSVFYKKMHVKDEIAMMEEEEIVFKVTEYSSVLQQRQYHRVVYTYSKLDCVSGILTKREI